MHVGWGEWFDGRREQHRHLSTDFRDFRCSDQRHAGQSAGVQGGLGEHRAIAHGLHRRCREPTDETAAYSVEESGGEIESESLGSVEQRIDSDGTAAEEDAFVAAQLTDTVEFEQWQRIGTG